MESRYGASSGIWEIYQDMATNEVSLYTYGELVETWKESRRLSWDELFEIMAKKSKERGEANGHLSE